MADCVDKVNIVKAEPLRFGTLAVRRNEHGVVIVSPLGGVATIGDIITSNDFQPATLRICGPAGARFSLSVQPHSLDLAKDADAEGSLFLSDLEVMATGAALVPMTTGKWEGSFGPSGEAEVYIGATLRVSSVVSYRDMTAPILVTLSSSS